MKKNLLTAALSIITILPLLGQDSLHNIPY